MFVSDIGVKPVVTVPKYATLEEVAQMMRESHVGCVVVVEEDKKQSNKYFPVGVITDRDVVVESTGQGAKPEKLCADDVMASDLFTVKSDVGISEVIRIMNNRAVRRVPVVDASGHLCGIITADDVLSYLAAGLNAVAKVSHAQRIWEKEVRK